MKITFNTGRLYTTLGQVITAELHEDRILFKDHSRLICGEIKIDGEPPAPNVKDTACWVMLFYDAGKYRMSTEAINLDQSDTIHNIKF